MYEVTFYDGEFWISKNGKRIQELGGFIDPLTPELLIKEIENESNNI